MRVRLGEETTEALVGIVLDDVGLPRRGPVWLALYDHRRDIEVATRRSAIWRDLGRWGPVALKVRAPGDPEVRFQTGVWVCASPCGERLRLVEGPLMVADGDTVHIRDFTVTVS